MDNKNFGFEKSRRAFLKSTGILAAGSLMAPSIVRAADGRPAVMGGSPVRTKAWPEWPIWDKAKDEPLVVDDLRSGIWSRASLVTQFEKEWAGVVGTKRCLSVVNGTNALITSLLQLGIGGGDEVIIPVYTFIATAAAVLATGAMPVFVDTDAATWQIDPTKIEAAITPKTRAILPVHILGLPADMVKIMSIAKKHGLVVIEDACQAHMAEINGKRVGSFGDAGCFSFQNSKNLAIGEGGAITSDNEAFMDKCYSYHNYGNPYGSVVGQVNAGTLIAGNKLRLTEYQAAIGLTQMKRLAGETDKRNANAAYLRSKLAAIPGVIPYTFTPGVTKAAFHLFPFRYNAEGFKGLSRTAFLKALNAEGIPCSEGYSPLNKMPYLQNAFQSKNFQKMYSAADLDINKYNERNQCPVNDKLCSDESVWFYQSMLLAERSDMDDIVNAIQKIHDNADKLKKQG